MTKATYDFPKEGERFTLARDVDRFPHALVPAGTSGTIAYADKEAIGLRLDEPFEGLDEWDNELIWYSDAFGMSVNEMIDSFREDATPGEPSATPSP